MPAEAGQARRVGAWGPVCRGFRVSLPDCKRGWVEDIRLGDDGVELLVATELSARRLLTISAAEVAAILPEARLILVADVNRWLFELQKLFPLLVRGSRFGWLDWEQLANQVRVSRSLAIPHGSTTISRSTWRGHASSAHGTPCTARPRRPRPSAMSAPPVLTADAYPASRRALSKRADTTALSSSNGGEPAPRTRLAGRGEGEAAVSPSRSKRMRKEQQWMSSTECEGHRRPLARGTRRSA